MAGEELLTQIVDLDRARLVREHGTAGLNTMWKQLRDRPVPPFLGSRTRTEAPCCSFVSRSMRHLRTSANCTINYMFFGQSVIHTE